MRIVVEAMSGDRGPSVVVDGAVQAARDFGVELILVGREDVLRPELDKHDAKTLPIRIVHAADVIDMHDHIMAVKRRKTIP